MIHCAGVAGVGDGWGVVSYTTRLLSVPALSTVKVLSVMLWLTSLAGVVLRVLASLLMPTVSVSQVILWWMAFPVPV